MSAFLVAFGEHAKVGPQKLSLPGVERISFRRGIAFDSTSAFQVLLGFIAWAKPLKILQFIFK